MKVKMMNGNDIFLSRLQLLIIMAKAFLKGMPLGEHRRKSILMNAEQVFYTSLHLANSEADRNVCLTAIGSGERSEGDTHIFFQRIQLLSVMAKAIADDRLSGEYKRKALEENVNYLCGAITFQEQLNDMAFLKVA
jgi:hypothetical protein